MLSSGGTRWSYRERSLAICHDGLFTAPSAGPAPAKLTSSVINELLRPVWLCWQVGSPSLWSVAFLEHSLLQCKDLPVLISRFQLQKREHRQPLQRKSVCLESHLWEDSTHCSYTSVSKWGATSLTGAWCPLESPHQGIWISPSGHSPADSKTSLCSLSEEQLTDVLGSENSLPFSRLTTECNAWCPSPLDWARTINPSLVQAGRYIEPIVIG